MMGSQSFLFLDPMRASLGPPEGLCFWPFSQVFSKDSNLPDAALGDSDCVELCGAVEQAGAVPQL